MRNKHLEPGRGESEGIASDDTERARALVREAHLRGFARGATRSLA